MKKILATMMLAFALVIVGGQQNQAEAYEVEVGTYDGVRSVYIITETVRRSSTSCSCTVRTGRDYLDYNFFLSNGNWYYTNSEGYEGWVYNGSSPVAANILNYCLRR